FAEHGGKGPYLRRQILNETLAGPWIGQDRRDPDQAQRTRCFLAALDQRRLVVFHDLSNGGGHGVVLGWPVTVCILHSVLWYTMILSAQGPCQRLFESDFVFP